MIFKAILLFTVCFPIYSDEIPSIWEVYQIDISQVQKNKLEKLNSVLVFIENLPSEKKLLSEKFYKKHSKFELLFGFSFNGKKLQHWILSRIRKLKVKKIKDYLALTTGSELILSESFFELSLLEQSIVLVHEARHSDGSSFAHIACPDDFPYLSQRNPEASLPDLEACDDRADGAYGITAAYLFELICYYPTDRELLVGKFNSELLRIIKR